MNIQIDGEQDKCSPEGSQVWAPGQLHPVLLQCYNAGEL